MSNTDDFENTSNLIKSIPSTLKEDEKQPLEFIYLLREREFIRLSEETYKIGKTTQPRLKRFDQYPNGSEVLFFRCVKDCDTIEAIIIRELKKSFKIMKCYGNEYFNGDFYEMIYTINSIIDKEQKQTNINNKQYKQYEESESEDEESEDEESIKIEHIVQQFINTTFTVTCKDTIKNWCKVNNKLESYREFRLYPLKLSSIYSSFVNYYKDKTGHDLMFMNIKKFNTIITDFLPNNVEYDKNNRIYKNMFYKIDIDRIYTL